VPNSVMDVIKVDLPSILVFRIGQLGDTLVAMPAINSIRSRFPKHKLILLTDRHLNKNVFISSWDILGPTKWFDDVIFYEPTPSIFGRIFNLITLFKQLKKFRFEYVFDLSPSRSYKQLKRDRFFFTRLLGITNYFQAVSPTATPQAENGKLLFVTPEWKRLLSIVNDNIECRDILDEISFNLPIPTKYLIEAKTLLDKHQLDEHSQFIGIGPGSKMPAKQWSFENYAELGKHLLLHYPEMHLLVVGGKEDAETGADLCRQWGERAHNLAGELSIYGSAAILKHCICYVGNDTGTMHLAGMVGTRCVSIFSARDYPGKWEPYGTLHKILRTDIECAGCMLEICSNNNACLCQISVDQVVDAVEGILNT